VVDLAVGGTLAAFGGRQMVATNGRAAHVLLVEDDLALAATVCDSLRVSGHCVWHVDRGADAEAAVDRLRPDLVVLDLILPDRNGLVLCATLKARTGTPVIICSATKRHDDAVIGLHLGADDFVHKPFSLDELQARIDLVLRRSARPLHTPPEASVHVQRVGTLAIDTGRCRVTVGDEVLPLTPIEYRLLRRLASRSPEVLHTRHLDIRHDRIKLTR